MRIAILFFSLLLLSGCVATAGEPKFERMSEEELAAYNQGKPISQMIVCGDDERNFSRIRRRACMTVTAMYGSVEAAAELNALNTVPGYSQ